MTSSAKIPSVDLFASAHKRDPFPFYARLRGEAPAAQARLPVFGPAWLLTRHADVEACLKDAGRFVKNPRNAGAKNRRILPWWLPESLRALERNMLDVDGADHRRLRGLVNQAFSRRRVQALRARMLEIADQRIDALPKGAAFDLVADFALPLPMTVICELIGAPSADHQKFHRWSAAFLTARSHWGILRAAPRMLEALRYLRRLAAARRAEPRDDLISELIAARDGQDRLSEAELVAMLVLLMVAGHETTTNLIGSGALALLEHPRERERFCAEPAAAGRAVQELARFTAPVETATERYAAEDVAIGDAVIRRGDLVFAVIASANRDPAVFDAPDRLDLARAPNPHLAFGDGVHFCAGRELALAEAEIGLSRLFARAPSLRLAAPASSLRWRAAPVVRGLAALPVRAERHLS